MYLARLLGWGSYLSTEPAKLDDQKLIKIVDHALQAGIEAIEKLNLTPEELKESHNKQKAYTVAWLAIYAAVCSLPLRPTWEQLPGAKEAYERALQN